MQEDAEHDLVIPYDQVIPHDQDTADYDREYYSSSGPLDYDRFDVDEFSDDEHHHTFDERQDERLFSIDHYNDADDT